MRAGEVTVLRLEKAMPTSNARTSLDSEKQFAENVKGPRRGGLPWIAQTLPLPQQATRRRSKRLIPVGQYSSRENKLLRWQK
jgi:hypothetical protein